MARGSRKPLLPESVKQPLKREDPVVKLRDGSTCTALECLLNAGDFEIAAERANMTELAFGQLLVRSDPSQLAEVLRSMQIIDAFQVSRHVGAKILSRLDEMKPDTLIRVYPDLVRLLPELAIAPIRIQATQNNVTVEGSGTKLPPHVEEALRALGIDLDSDGIPEAVEVA